MIRYIPAYKAYEVLGARTNGKKSLVPYVRIFHPKSLQQNLVSMCDTFDALGESVYFTIGVELRMKTI